MVRTTKSKKESISDFTEHFYKLKELCRTGWKEKMEIENAESVASHTLLMIVLVFFLSEKYRYSYKKKVRLIEMALIHDLAESIIGDITPETMNENKKRKLENDAFCKITEKMSPKILKKKYLELWHEYQTNKSFESKFIHLIDKLEMVVQAKYYLDNRKEVKDEMVRPFFHSGMSYISHRPNLQLLKTSKKNIQHNKQLKDIKEILECFCN
ncbi:HD domain-containing protein [Candidatus Nitrosocosmicus arcticus]|uniref:Metal dependent phosphohydrolase n=1 Tax=Candidatus Nitrosocosmicus arcticus TaxID=2035267 RepID=A0A557SYT3_9ARCH|nr:HD domain-containing protein [Candidatus Nitrosocosmicus arcticus]TVP41761.1 Metal dependent phosphohydrolase [Candidatus Nitrosocosmicus arcticus]